MKWERQIVAACMLGRWKVVNDLERDQHFYSRFLRIILKSPISCYMSNMYG